MANLRRFELEELVTRPGTYVNPDTEIVIVVDDGGHVDAELLEGDGADWIAVSDDVPIDEHQRDELLERLQARAGGGAVEDPEEEDDDPDFASAGFEESEGLE
jgi:hypothetical protein